LNYSFLKPVPEPPAIRDAMAKVSKREENDMPVYDFSSGNIGRLLMEYEIFKDISFQAGETPTSFESIAEALARGIKKSFAGKPKGLAYSPTGGTEAQKETAIKYFSLVHGLPLAKKQTDRVIITAGGQQAMAAALRSISSGSKVIVPRWDYAPVTGIASDESWEFSKLPPTKGLGFSLDDLREEAEEGSVFYTSMPNNPSGYVSAEKLRGAAEIMTETGGGIIWDAPYIFTMFKIEEGKASFNSDFLKKEVSQFNSIAEQFQDNMCILSSISKTCLAAGLRFGFATAPSDWIKNMNAIVGRENLSSPTASFVIGNEILETFLEEDVMAHEWVSEILASRVNYLLSKGLPLILPENGKFGALYVLLKSPKPGSEFADELSKSGIIAVTGEPFYGGRVEAVRLSLVSVPYQERDVTWKENVDKLAEVIGEN